MSALGRLYWKIRHCRERFGETNPAQPERPAKPRSSSTTMPRAGFALLLALLMGAGLANAQTDTQNKGNDVIARVNGVVITRRAFQVVYRQAVDRHAREGHPIDETHLAPLRRKVIQHMVEEELLVQESRRLGISIAGETVDQDVAAARARFETPEAFQQEIARLYGDVTGYRRHLKRQRAVDRLLTQEVDPAVSVSQTEMRRFYEANPQRYRFPEKIRVRHILVHKDGGEENTASDAGYRKISMIRKKLVQGGDFADLAAEYSQESSWEHGGDLGFIERGQMPPSIESVVFGLAVGDVSPILTTEHDYHLIQVTERRPATIMPFEDAQTEIEKTLRGGKQKQAMRAYIDTLRKRAEIQTAQ